jgi:uncharacterized protein involved in exopolysaccharide biosynthesis
MAISELDSDYVALNATVQQLEARMDAAAQSIGALESRITEDERSELESLRSRVGELQSELAGVKQRLSAIASRRVSLHIRDCVILRTSSRA